MFKLTHNRIYSKRKLKNNQQLKWIMNFSHIYLITHIYGIQKEKCSLLVILATIYKLIWMTQK